MRGRQLYDKRCAPAPLRSPLRGNTFLIGTHSRREHGTIERKRTPRAREKERGEGGGEGEKRRKLNRFGVRRENERTLRCDSRLWRRSASLQSRNPAFPLGKAEDYGNGYDGERRVPLKTGESGANGANGASFAVYRRRRRFSIHAVTRVLGQGRKSPPLPFPGGMEYPTQRSRGTMGKGLINVRQFRRAFLQGFQGECSSASTPH